MNGLLDVLTLRRLAPRDRRAVLLGMLALLPALLYIAAVRPYRAALEDVRERAAAERSLLEREEALVAGAAAGPGMESLHSTAQQAALRLVSAANVPLAEAEVTTFLEELALLSRVLLQELRGVEPRRGETFTGTLRPIRLSVRGESDLEGIMTFLQRIENSPLLMRINELAIEPQYVGSARGADRRATGVVGFALVLEAYASPDIETPPTTATGVRP
jgi:hypothetical protein